MAEKTRYSVGLVLEGGGMRGIYTAGVLDCLIDYDIRVPYVIGTSAGATQGVSYLSKQKNRSRFCDTDLLRMHNYIGIMPMISGHGVIDMDFLFTTFPDEIYPFDFETYQQSGSRMVMVASDVTTGKAVYLEDYTDVERFTAAARASCSLPIMCPMGQVDGVKMVDGGVTDSIPFEHAIEDGCEKLIVVLTKESGYRKKSGPIYLPSMVYRQYPELRNTLCNRNDAYNVQLDRLEALAIEGRVMIIRPEESYGVGRTTDDVDRLDALYDHGYRQAQLMIKEIQQYIQS